MRNQIRKQVLREMKKQRYKKTKKSRLYGDGEQNVKKKERKKEYNQKKAKVSSIFFKKKTRKNLEDFNKT